MGLFSLPLRERIEWEIVAFGYITWHVVSRDVHLLALLVLLYAYWLNQKIIKLQRQVNKLEADKQPISRRQTDAETE